MPNPKFSIEHTAPETVLDHMLDVGPARTLRRRTLLASAAAAPLVMSGLARAQDRWPSRPVTIISPYNPGGTNDIVARLVADRLQRTLGQPFIVENRAGAAGVVGVQYVMKAKPDGYTLLSGNNGALVIQAAGRVNGPYDPTRQLTPIMRVVEAMQFISVSGDLPVNNVGELIAYAKQRPGQLNYSSAGTGSFGHFLMAYFMQLTGTDMVHVPSKGSAAALTELMAHRIQLLMDPISLSQASDKRIRILATLNPQRLEAYPQFPTMKESGGPEIDLGGWFGVHGPAGLSPEIVERISSVGRAMQTDPEARKIFSTAGLVSAFSEPSAFGELVRADMERVADIRNRAKIQLD